MFMNIFLYTLFTRVLVYGKFTLFSAFGLFGVSKVTSQYKRCGVGVIRGRCGHGEIVDI
jgi:hypothetical protein